MARQLWAAAVALAAVAAVAAATSDGVDPLTDCGGITTAGNRYTDGCGRQRFFRGVNKVAKAPPYYPSPSVFTPGESVTPADMALWRSLGFNVVRLGVMMTGVLPEPSGVPDATYLAVVANMTAALYSYGVYTLVDFHQDALSPAFCDDGAPGWAVQVWLNGSDVPGFPEPLAPALPMNATTGVPLPGACENATLPWAEYYFAEAVCAAFQAMYTQPALLAAHWTAVVGALHPVGPGILFWGLMNEPWPGNVYADPALLIPGVADRVNLQPLYTNLSVVIRDVEAGTPGGSPRIVMSEGITFDDFFPVGFDALPGAAEGLGTLSFHYYELPNFDVDWQVAARVADAARLGVPAILTEFDIAIIDPWETISVASVEHVLDVCDAAGVSYIGWEYADMYWGGNGSLALITSTVLSRPYPMAVAGNTTAYGYNTTTGRFGLTYSLTGAGAASGLPTVVFVNPETTYPTGFQVLVNGPANATLAWHNASTPFSPGGGGTPPTPFNYAYVLVTASPTAPPGAVVSLTLLPTA